MPLPGGAAAKFGDRYEGRWTLTALADILDERAQLIRLEPPGNEGEGVEFSLTVPGRTEYHQVKRQSTHGGWSIQALGKSRVLSHFEAKLRDPNASCLFVSADSAGDLRELSERARAAAHWPEYREEFLKDQQNSANFSRLKQFWLSLTDEQVHERLQRVHVRTVDEISLRSLVEARLGPLVDGDPQTVADILAQFVLDNVHRELRPQNLWTHLEGRGHRRRAWACDRHVLAAVDALNERYLAGLRRDAIAGHILPRAETVDALDALSQNPRGILVVGEAGGGKSGVLHQLVEALRERTTPVLVFRVDRLEPTQLPAAIGQQLALPGSPPVVLAGVAGGRDSVLVIDQLDAVSLASGRNPHFFECIAEIMRQASAHPQMKVVLACRRFDLDNDDRFRREVSMLATVSVGQLQRTAVEEVLRDNAFDVGTFSESQLRVLSLPLHLSLLLEGRTADGNRFETAYDLYDRFWDRKERALRDRLGRPAAMVDVIDVLSEYMSDRQTLAAPSNIVDRWRGDAEAMVSEHVLSLDARRYSFFHESFFDYAFARGFTARRQPFVPFLLRSEQHLFRRAQVRQVLIYQRDADFPGYIATLRALLEHAEIRVHIKDVVFAFLRGLTIPTDNEWRVVVGLPKGPQDLLASDAWRVVYGAAQWLRVLTQRGVIRRWLESADDDQVDRVVHFLRSVQRGAADDLADLVTPYVGRSERWNRRLLYLARWGDAGAGRRYFELFLRLLEEGVLDDVRGPIAVNSDFWSLVYTLPKQQPGWAAELVGHYLERQIARTKAAGERNPLADVSSQTAGRVFSESATRAPNEFVNAVLPPMLGAMEIAAEPGDQNGRELRRDEVWRYRFSGNTHSVPGELLHAMETALRRMAADDGASFAPVAASLRESPWETAHYLLIRAYTAGGHRYADEAAAYLSDTPEAFAIGYGGDPYGAARELLAGITPDCAPENLSRLEEMLLQYYPKWERTNDGRRFHGSSLFTLLNAIANDRRSDRVTRRLQELSRKFGAERRRTPPPSIAQPVGSPIPVAAAARMTDDQWRRALEKYTAEDIEQRGRRLVGGVRQLAALLENQVAGDPQRFLRLTFALPHKTHPSYFSAILRGLSRGGAGVDVVGPVIRRLHEVPGRPCGREIADALEKLGDADIPDDLLSILVWYAIEDRDPAGELWRTEAWSGSKYYGGDVLSAGINSVRGSAADAVAALLFDDKDGIRRRVLRPALEQMVRDRSAAVRSCVARALLSLLRWDQDAAVALFLLLADAEDALLATATVEDFLRYAVQTHYQQLRAVLGQMLDSELADVRRVGARLVAIAALGWEEAHGLLERIVSGSIPERLGAAEILAAYVNVPQWRTRCSEGLAHLFNDEEKEVREHAASCFRQLHTEPLAVYRMLIEAFLASPAIGDASYDLIDLLEETPEQASDIVVSVAERFLDIVGPEAGDISSRASLEASKVSKVLIRAYTQATDERVKSRCLDLVDRMVKIEAHGLAEALGAYER